MRPLLALLLILILPSCSKQSDNGDLDGKWHLREQYVRTSAAEPFSATNTVAASDIYWSFQLQLLYISGAGNHNATTSETFCRFAHEGERLSVTQAYVHHRDHDDLIDPATDTAALSALASVGLRQLPAAYRVERLTASSLILVSDTDSLVFRQIH